MTRGNYDWTSRSPGKATEKVGRKASTTIRISDKSRQELKELADNMRISQAAVMELAIRNLYQKETRTMNIPLNYQPSTEYKGHAIEIATGIGGYYARTTFKISDDEHQLIEVGPNDSEQGALQSMRNSIKDALFAYGFADEPS